MSDRVYTKSHEWVAETDGTVRMGITDYAQEQLGDVVYVELPTADEEVEKGDTMGSIESVKAVSDIYAPVSGTVVAVNEALEDSPELANSDPYGDGWLVEIKLSNPDELSELMDQGAYDAFVKEEKEKD